MTMALAPPQFESKIKLGPALIDAVALLPRPLVFTNGVFDVLHRGHVTYLAEARRQGYSLLVALNSDASARRLGKGPERPINNQDDRAALIAALGDVDCVTLFDEDTPYQLIDLVRPDVLVKGGDYDMSRLAEAKLVTSYGGRVLAIDFVHQRSTSALVKRIRESAT
jgi:rfaE bifunctional protein nucleotidyltransferase chain/domain